MGASSAWEQPCSMAAEGDSGSWLDHSGWLVAVGDCAVVAPAWLRLGRTDRRGCAAACGSGASAACFRPGLRQLGAVW